MSAHNRYYETLEHFDSLPNSAFVREPVVRALFACSSTTIWRGIKQGRIPVAKKLSPNTIGWNVGELRKALAARLEV